MEVLRLICGRAKRIESMIGTIRGMLGLAITRWFLFRAPAFVVSLLSFSLVTVRAEAPAGSRAPEVRLDQGVLSGSRYGAAGAAFLGIPYAVPPVGLLRWAPPQETKP